MGKIARAEIGMALDGKPSSEWRSSSTPRSSEQHFSKHMLFRHGSVDRVALSNSAMFFFRSRYRAPRVLRRRKMK